MKLYQGGFSDYQFFTVAETEEEAISNIQKIEGMAWLPVTVKPIDSVDGYHIVAYPKAIPIEEVKENVLITDVPAEQRPAKEYKPAGRPKGKPTKRR